MERDSKVTIIVVDGLPDVVAVRETSSGLLVAETPCTLVEHLAGGGALICLKKPGVIDPVMMTAGSEPAPAAAVAAEGPEE
jgi:hypothetical protein